MTEPVVVEIDRDDAPDEMPSRSRQLRWPAAGLAVLALVAVLVGRAQTPPTHAVPTPSPTVRSLGTLVVWAHSMSTATRGDGSMIIDVDIKNLSANPVTLTNPQVMFPAGVTDVEAAFVDPQMTGLLTQDRWDRPVGHDNLIISPLGLGTLAIRFHLGCTAVSLAGPYITSVWVFATAGLDTDFRDVTPETSLISPDDLGKPVCHQLTK